MKIVYDQWKRPDLCEVVPIKRDVEGTGGNVRADSIGYENRQSLGEFHYILPFLGSYIVSNGGLTMVPLFQPGEHGAVFITDKFRESQIEFSWRCAEHRFNCRRCVKAVAKRVENRA